MLNKIMDRPFLEWLIKNRQALLIILLGLSLGANYYLWLKYTTVVEQSIEFERDRVRTFDEIVKKLIDQHKSTSPNEQ